MDSAWIPALCGLAGALVGALASAVGVFVAQREATKREHVSELVKAGMQQWAAYHHDFAVGRAKTALYPPVAYFLGLAQLAPLLVEADKVSDEMLAKRLRTYFAKVKVITDECEKNDPACASRRAVTE